MRGKIFHPRARQSTVYAFQGGSRHSEREAGGEGGGAAGEPAGAHMPLRDWFAGQALVGVLAKMTHDEYLGSAHVQIVDDAYRLADAMLARRDEG